MPRTKKRPKPDHNTPPKATDKRTKENEEAICLICQPIIIEGEGDDNADSDDTIFCEGGCKGWLHRKCIGMSKLAYDKLTNSEDPYMCPNCTILKQSQEISELKDLVKNLTSELENVKGLQQQLTNLEKEPPSVNNKPTIPNTLDSDDTSSGTVIPVSASLVTQNTSKLSSTQVDRKFNVVIYGILECPKGTKRHDRTKQDLSNVISAVSQVDSDITSHSIRDCFRLGQYKEHAERPRPLLIKLNRTIDVASLLSKRSSLPKDISIKPDMSHAERTTESVLMKERWRLIQSGIDRKTIRIQSTNIYVNNKLHGKACNSSFVPSPTPNTSNPSEITTDLPSDVIMDQSS